MHVLIQELKNYHRDKASHLTSLLECVRWHTENDYSKESLQEIAERFGPFQRDAERAHHRNEELILRELRTTGAPIHRRVDEIGDDHLALDRITSAISSKLVLLAEAPEVVCGDILQFIRTYDDHAVGEESIFFPIADQYLAKPQWLRIEKEWDRL